MWLQLFVRPQTTIYCVCWVVPFLGISFMLFSSQNSLLAVVTILLMFYTVDLFYMFKVVPLWEFCMLVYSMVLLKFCQISVLRSLVFLTVCSSIILLGFSFILFKNPTFGHKTV